MVIEKYLISKGFDPSLKGFEYIVKCIHLVRQDREYILQITKKLYPKIAEIYNDSVQNVERAIRHCISKSQYRRETNGKLIAILEIETR